ncbi:protein phosphatase 2C domain-containing protein [Streptomyces sp. CNQ085]|nr:protein phosphatase 2C domain-containing protein [Streptomyces sp. CNQ085]MCI0383219.1 protein phosphatase 2C domain-containing protein [Streptomyces sp. CNQ085]
MPQPDRPSVCPRCQEPLEDGDLHRGACGAGPAAGTGVSQPSAPLLIPPPPAAPPMPPVPPTPPAVPPAVPDTAQDGSDYVLPPPATGTVDAEGRCEHCGHAQPRERDHMEESSEGVAAISDRGLRHHRNEDSFALSSVPLPDGSPAVIAVVCDGVSSATRPDEASAAAAESACASLRRSLPRGADPRQAVHDALVAAAEAVNALAPEPRDPVENAPACTIVGAVVAAGLLTVGWIGDSRAYWVPDDRSATPARLTEDDSWAAQMVAAGLMEEAEAYADARAHAITGWLGADAYEIDPHTASFTPDRPGVVVVCTDGLWNYAESAGEMAAAVPADARTHPMRSARHLVGHALDGGGHDNVTVAVLPFSAPPGS